MSACEARSFLGIITQLLKLAPGAVESPEYERCTRPATRRVASGCVHEHILTWQTCGECASEIIRQVNYKPEAPRCIECKRLGHICPVMVTSETLAEVAT